MHAGRLLFARHRRSALAPIYVALVLLALLSIFELALALWPAPVAPYSIHPNQGEAQPASRAFEGGLHVAPDAEARRDGGRGTWM